MKNRPYIICHMVSSIDGKVTGDFLYRPECEKATDIYYRLNREYNADAFACGRITMEGSFTFGWYPDISNYPQITSPNDVFVPDDTAEKYAVAFDPHGRLGWKSNKISDPDPGYGGKNIIEIVCENIDPRYFGYLQKMNIAYIVAGKDEIDLPLALFKLKSVFGINTLLLEGGSIINGAFERQALIDEISIVTAPLTADKNDKPLFDNSLSESYKIADIRKFDDAVWTVYKK